MKLQGGGEEKKHTNVRVAKLILRLSTFNSAIPTY